MHVDTPARDSLACDLMEPVRSNVDSYVLDWITRQPLKREWFFEQREGNCRLMGPFAVRLSETAQIWRRAVGPVAEFVTRQLWSTSQKRTQNAQARIVTLAIVNEANLSSESQAELAEVAYRVGSLDSKERQPTSERSRLARYWGQNTTTRGHI